MDDRIYEMNDRIYEVREKTATGARPLLFSKDSKCSFICWQVCGYNVERIVPNYKDNRFNALFESATWIISSVITSGLFYK